MQNARQLRNTREFRKMVEMLRAVIAAAQQIGRNAE
jgi:hypothetical protein